MEPIYEQWRLIAKELAEALQNEMNPPKGPTGGL
jgi:hypothetical protein